MDVKGFSGSENHALFQKLTAAGLGIHSPSDPGPRPSALPIHHVSVERKVGKSSVSMDIKRIPAGQYGRLGVMMADEGKMSGNQEFNGRMFHQITQDYSQNLPEFMRKAITSQRVHKGGNFMDEAFSHDSRLDDESDVHEDLIRKTMAHRFAQSLMPKGDAAVDFPTDQMT